MDVKKILGIAAIALVAFFLISAPNEASSLVTNILGMLKDAANAVVTFVQSLF